MIKQLKAVDVPVDFSEWCHPDLYLIDPRMTDDSEESYSKEEWTKMQSDGGIEIKAESHCIEDVALIVGDDLEDWSGWEPTPPSNEHFLLCAYSTEYDSIVLWWAKEAKADAEET
ncbi:hypothetical protein [Acinetobacter higginsii]|uniref:hypothetical protein n=1 Tax=Acinetobacter higginsii TaxID=70347 RepID=UPI001F4A0DAC|nr:hypothetical protein [Acinetobacter higginsii]MCH7381287.1 hypothetical protein [Acinetobacter higginsii]